MCSFKGTSFHFVQSWLFWLGKKLSIWIQRSLPLIPRLKAVHFFITSDEFLNDCLNRLEVVEMLRHAEKTRWWFRDLVKVYRAKWLRINSFLTMFLLFETYQGPSNSCKIYLEFIRNSFITMFDHIILPLRRHSPSFLQANLSHWQSADPCVPRWFGVVCQQCGKPQSLCIGI